MRTWLCFTVALLVSGCLIQSDRGGGEESKALATIGKHYLSSWGKCEYNLGKGKSFFAPGHVYLKRYRYEGCDIYVGIHESLQLKQLIDGKLVKQSQLSKQNASFQATVNFLDTTGITCKISQQHLLSWVFPAGGHENYQTIDTICTKNSPRRKNIYVGLANQSSVGSVLTVRQVNNQKHLFFDVFSTDKVGVIKNHIFVNKHTETREVVLENYQLE